MWVGHGGWTNRIVSVACVINISNESLALKCEGFGYSRLDQARGDLRQGAVELHGATGIGKVIYKSNLEGEGRNMTSVSSGAI